MSQLVADCPRCSASHTTFDLVASVHVHTQWSWNQKIHEAFCICRRCHKSTVFVLVDRSPNAANILRRKELHDPSLGSANDLVEIDGFISSKDRNSIQPPEHVPDEVGRAFEEGASCLSIGCYNAAAAMFRLSLDLATKSLLSSDEENLPARTRRDLGLRLQWLFQENRLPKALEDLSSCIKHHGNDGVHDGCLTKEDATDLLDFSEVLLERLYTEPERIRIAMQRRDQRRKESS